MILRIIDVDRELVTVYSSAVEAAPLTSTREELTFSYIPLDPTDFVDAHTKLSKQGLRMPTLAELTFLLHSMFVPNEYTLRAPELNDLKHALKTGIWTDSAIRYVKAKEGQGSVWVRDNPGIYLSGLNGMDLATLLANEGKQGTRNISEGVMCVGNLSIEMLECDPLVKMLFGSNTHYFAEIARRWKSSIHGNNSLYFEGLEPNLPKVLGYKIERITGRPMIRYEDPTPAAKARKLYSVGIKN